PAANLTVMAPPVSGGILIRITGAARAYTLEVSTNLLQWSGLFTNRQLTGGQVEVSASAGGASALSSFLAASQPSLMDSTAHGLRTLYVDGTPQVGSWLQLLVTKTNGLVTSAAVTNSDSSATVASLTQTLLAAINSSPGLQGSA